MARLIFKPIPTFAIIAAALLVGLVILTLSQPSPAPTPLPKPNGYDGFLEAGRMLTNKGAAWTASGPADLRAMLAQSAEALNLARQGLSNECRVPLSYSLTNTMGRDNELVLLKQLALTFVAAGRLAELESRPDDAAEAYLTTIRLGHEMCNGGIRYDCLMGSAVEALGLAPLEKLAASLDARRCREIAAALETAESKTESAETIIARERDWARHALGLEGQLRRLIAFASVRRNEKVMVARMKTVQTRTRLFIIQLAARAYELEKGERPKKLADLVPGYLKAIPQDPFTGTNLLYGP
jgi:hypothetical protein